jgi:hypothetical protein
LIAQPLEQLGIHPLAVLEVIDGNRPIAFAGRPSPERPLARPHAAHKPDRYDHFASSSAKTTTIAVRLARWRRCAIDRRHQ